MSGDDGSLARNPRVYAVLNGVIGVLLVALALLDDSTEPLGIGRIAMVLGGGLLVGAALLGVWRPDRWSVSIDDALITWAYVLAVISLVVALVLRFV